MNKVTEMKSGATNAKILFRKHLSTDMKHFLEDCPVFTSPDKRWTMQGQSRANQCTGFMGGGMLNGVFFDAGVRTRKKPKLVLLTHSHLDHCNALSEMCRAAKEQEPLTVMMPPEAVEPIRQKLFGDAMAAACCSDPNKIDRIPISIIAGIAGSGQHYIFGNLRITPIVLDHNVPCIGFYIEHICSRLMSKYEDCTPQMIAEARKKGEIVTEVQYMPLLYFGGDTTIQPFLDGRIPLTAPVIFTECTELIKLHEGEATTKHTLATDLLELLYDKDHIRYTWVLIHLSYHKTDKEIYKYFNESKLYCKDIRLWLTTGPKFYREANCSLLSDK
jgi:ribonuclease BN (tRNA processing enzyme)